MIKYIDNLLSSFDNCCYVTQSTLLSTLTHTESEAASYEFTTLTCIPGVIEYKGANVQLLDLPGIIEGASQGKGRGRQVSLLSLYSRNLSAVTCVHFLRFFKEGCKSPFTLLCPELIKQLGLKERFDISK